MAKPKPRAAVGRRPSRYEREREATPPNVRPEWRWRSFPVFAAFVTGALIAFLVNGQTQNPAAAVLLIGSVAGFGYCLAHLVVVNVVLAGRRRRRRAAIELGESPDAEMEDVVVYPDEPSNAP